MRSAAGQSSSRPQTARLVEPCRRRSGSPRRAPMRRASASFAISRRMGPSYRFVALRYVRRRRRTRQVEPYQLFETADYTYRVFVTNLKHAVDLLVWFYNQRAGAENLIKKSPIMMRAGRLSLGALGDELHPFPDGHAGLQLDEAVQSGRKGACGRPEAPDLGDLPVALPVLATKIWRHGDRVGVSYSDHYAEQGFSSDCCSGCERSRSARRTMRRCWPWPSAPELLDHA